MSIFLKFYYGIYLSIYRRVTIIYADVNLVPRAFPLKVGGAALPPSRERPWERGCADVRHEHSRKRGDARLKTHSLAMAALRSIYMQSHTHTKTCGAFWEQVGPRTLNQR